MSNSGGARRYFWIIMIAVALLVCGMVYYLSMAQAREDKESEMLETQLNEQISSTEGIKNSVQQVTEENELLKQEIAENEQEILALYKENKTLASFAELQTLYITGENNERMKALAEEINRESLSPSQMSVYDKIVSEIAE